ncbi:hypothetical protein ACWF0M_06675 [Kribbella sp. NPDC055110]
MSGHVVKHSTSSITRTSSHLSIPITPSQRTKLLQDGRLLVSYQSTDNEVQALDLRLTR